MERGRPARLKARETRALRRCVIRQMKSSAITSAIALSFRFALRDLRSGLQGFWIFLTCLALGTAAIAIVGSLGAAIERGMIEEGQPLLGGDIELALIHREAPERERAFMASKGEVSKIATLRGMAVTGGPATLVEIKAVDERYPFYGSVALDDGTSFRDALVLKDGRFGIAVDPLLLGRLGVSQGATIKIGSAEFQVRGIIAREPDRISDNILLGPRVLMSEEALRAAGLIQPGSLITWRYRIRLPPAATPSDVREVMREARQDFADTGWRVRGRNNAAPGTDRFIERLSYFLTLVGLTALIVGGAGIANAASAFVNRRVEAIAILKCLGAPGRQVQGIYLVEMLMVALISIALGLIAGAATPAVAKFFLSDVIPLPVAARIEIVPLIIAALFGLLVTIAFTMWPLARTRQVPASLLFRYRIAGTGGRPGPLEIAAIAVAIVLLAALAYVAFDDARITSIYLAGLAGSFLLLLGLAHLIVGTAERMPKPKTAILRYAIANLYRPGSAAASVILALGLGLTLFVTLTLTDRTISSELLSGIPSKAPAFYFLDVPNDQRQAFIDAVGREDRGAVVETAPMLRGRITKVGDTPADKIDASPDGAWALRGDRGLTYSDALPDGSRLTAGEWWPKDYKGPPLVSFVDEVAKGIGLKVGDKVTVNVLGRDVTATVASLRAVDWRTLGINFVMVFNPDTLKAAPHNHLVTVTMNGGDEARLVNEMARQFPAVSAIRVKDAIDTVSDLLAKMIAAIRGANAVTLLTGVLVLAGALSAGIERRIYDAVVLKTYGATRRQLILAFAMEYAFLGLAAAVFGIAVGSLGSWFLAYWILEMPWSFSALAAIATAVIAVILTVSAGLLVTWRALTIKPAGLLRNE
jgi:putative ABC transport system permease protein